MLNLTSISEAAKLWDLEVLEVALADAKKRAKDGMEISNLEYTKRQLMIAEILQNEILERKVSEY